MNRRDFLKVMSVTTVAACGRTFAPQPRPNEVQVLVRTLYRRDASPKEVLQRAQQLGPFTPDASYDPVRMRPRRQDREKYESQGLALWVVRGFIDPARIRELEARTTGDLPVLKVSRDSALDPLLVECGAGGAVGSVTNARIALGVKPIWKKGYQGQGIVVGVVDGGITSTSKMPKPGETARIDRVVDGWPPTDWGTTALGWGVSNKEHGNMVAFDVLAMAPQASLWDIRIWQDVAGTDADRFRVYVSNALSGYRFAINRFTTGGVPQILTNSWGLYDRNNGIEYATHVDSDFAIIVEEALDAGMLLLFAAGNCGTGCTPSTTLCGAADKGPGNSILGPNGHPEVMTVAGATVKADWYGYTSQGPAVLPPHAAKPDFCSITNFEGFFPFYVPSKPYDGGTSAACATAAGVVALLKQYKPSLTQAQVKAALTGTARDIQAAGVDIDSGAGIIRASAAFNAI
jgi:serine protease AprX